MFSIIIRSDKFDWDNIDYRLIQIDSNIIPTVGSTFIHKIESGKLNEKFAFIVDDVEYISSANYFNDDRFPKDEKYFINVYVEPISLNATYGRISNLLGRF